MKPLSIFENKTLLDQCFLAKTRASDSLKMLAKDGVLLKIYNTNLKDYFRERIAEKASNNNSEGCIYYLPH